MEKNNFEKVILARETPLDEIKKIHKGSDIEIEHFIHGALCVSYSGQCLMSSMIGGRSGNRGSCAQPCRMEYEIINYTSKEKIGDLGKKYFLSSKDLNSIDNISDLKEAGVKSLKIEGRMKRPEYVATVVNKYRKVLDGNSIDEEDKDEIKQIFNRSFTSGNTFGDFGKKFLSYERPDNRGVLIGEVVDDRRNNIRIKLLDDLNKGDGIEIESSRDSNFGIRWNEDSFRNQIVEIKNVKDIEVGAKVYRTSSSELLKKSKESFEEENIKYPLDIDLDLIVGNRPRAIGRSGDIKVEIMTDYIIENAKKAPLSEDRIIEQLEKLNDTVYYLDNIDILMDRNLFLPISELNEIRRVIVEKLDEKKSNFNKRDRLDSIDPNKNRFISKIDNLPENKLSISVSSIDQFNQLDLEKVDRIYLNFDKDLDIVLGKLKNRSIEVFIDTDKILYSKDLEILKSKLDLYKEEIDGVVANNSGTIEFLKENFNFRIHGGEGLNIFNPFTAEFYKEEGLESVSLSHELTLNQIKNITRYKNQVYETLVYGYVKVMTNKSCPMSVIKGCSDDSQCEKCNYKDNHGLLDRKGMEFYLERRNGNTLIYNSVPIMVLDSLRDISSQGVSYLKLDFTFEKENIREIQEIYYDYLKGNIDKNEVTNYMNNYRKDNKITKGHYFRGIM